MASSTKILGSMPFWSMFPPEIKPPNAKRGIVKPNAMGFDIVETGNGLYGDPGEIIESGIDNVNVGIPSSQLQFPNVYESYRVRIMPDGCEYFTMISKLSDHVMEKLKRLETTPDIFVAIPSRKEVDTSKAVEVIEQDCKQSGIKPFFLVLHNDVELPCEQTIDDLAKVRNKKNAVVIDMQFSRKSNIGDARAILADTVMETNYRLQKSITMVIADSDITKTKQGTFGIIASDINDGSDIDFSTPFMKTDLDTVRDDVTFCFTEEAREYFTKFIIKLLGSDMPVFAGGASAINPKGYLVVGGFPRLNMGEDIVLGIKYFGQRAMKMPENTLMKSYGSDEACVYFDGRRHLAAYQANPKCQSQIGARYEDWTSGANQVRTSTKKYELNINTATTVMNDFIHGLQSMGLCTPDNFKDGSPLSILIMQLRELCERYQLPIGSEEGQIHFHIVEPKII